MKTALLLLVLASACTPRMHRAYRTTVQIMTAAAVLCDDGQTRYALEMGYPEANPLLGSHPDGRLMTGVTLAHLGWTYALGRISDRVPDWYRDAIVTANAAIAGFVVWSNAQTVGMPITQCGAP